MFFVYLRHNHGKIIQSGAFLQVSDVEQGSRKSIDIYLKVFRLRLQIWFPFFHFQMSKEQLWSNQLLGPHQWWLNKTRDVATGGWLTEAGDWSRSGSWKTRMMDLPIYLSENIFPSKELRFGKNDIAVFMISNSNNTIHRYHKNQTFSNVSSFSLV